MSKIAFLFPGQGSQSIGMVRGLTAYPGALELFQQASRNLELDLFDLCLNGPEEILFQDLYAQVAVHVTNCAYAEQINRINLTPDGLRVLASESSPLWSRTGSLSFEQGLEGVRIAAEKMSAEGRFYQGAMAAIIGLSEGEVQSVCQEVNRVFVASINSSHQVVIFRRGRGGGKGHSTLHTAGNLISQTSSYRLGYPYPSNGTRLAGLCSRNKGLASPPAALPRSKLPEGGSFRNSRRNQTGIKRSIFSTQLLA